MFIQGYIISWVEIETQIPAVFSTTLGSPHSMEEMKMLPGPISKVLTEKKKVWLNWPPEKAQKQHEFYHTACQAFIMKNFPLRGNLTPQIQGKVI